VSSILVLGVSSWVAADQGAGWRSSERVKFWLLEGASDEDVESLQAAISAVPGVVSCTRTDEDVPAYISVHSDGFVEVVFSRDSGSRDVEAVYRAIEAHPAFARVVDDTIGGWSASVDSDRLRRRHPLGSVQVAIFLLGLVAVLGIPDTTSRALAASAAALAGAPMIFSSNAVVDWGDPVVDLLTMQFVSASWFSAGLMSLFLFALGLAGAAASLMKRRTARA